MNNSVLEGLLSLHVENQLMLPYVFSCPLNNSLLAFNSHSTIFDGNLLSFLKTSEKLKYDTYWDILLCLINYKMIPRALRGPEDWHLQMTSTSDAQSWGWHYSERVSDQQLSSKSESPNGNRPINQLQEELLILGRHRNWKDNPYLGDNILKLGTKILLSTKKKKKKKNPYKSTRNKWPMEKMVKRHEQVFQEETNKHVKRCSTTLGMREMQIKITMIRNSGNMLTHQLVRKPPQTAWGTSK